MYPNLPFGQEELAQVMLTTYDELIDFATTPEFKAVLKELRSYPSKDRPGFVMSVLLNPDELAKRGIQQPAGILIQRSAFGDRRPTLFCIKKYLPEKYASVTWQNVNLTFDDNYVNEVSRAPEIAWREPLPVDLQAKIMAMGGNLEEIDFLPSN